MRVAPSTPAAAQLKLVAAVALFTTGELGVGATPAGTSVVGQEENELHSRNVRGQRGHFEVSTSSKHASSPSASRPRDDQSQSQQREQRTTRYLRVGSFGEIEVEKDEGVELEMRLGPFAGQQDSEQDGGIKQVNEVSSDESSAAKKCGSEQGDLEDFRPTFLGDLFGSGERELAASLRRAPATAAVSAEVAVQQRMMRGPSDVGKQLVDPENSFELEEVMLAATFGGAEGSQQGLARGLRGGPGELGSGAGISWSWVFAEAVLLLLIVATTARALSRTLRAWSKRGGGAGARAGPGFSTLGGALGGQGQYGAPKGLDDGEFYMKDVGV